MNTKEKNRRTSKRIGILCIVCLMIIAAVAVGTVLIHHRDMREVSSDLKVDENEQSTEMPEREQQVEDFLSNMTLEEKIYQMFIVTPEQLTGAENVTAAGERTKNSLKERPVGGIIYFSQNLVSADQTRKMLSNTQDYAKELQGLPLFLSVDEEGGSVTRVAGNPAFSAESVGPMAEVTSAEEAYECGNIIGGYLSDLGFNLDFAPDADVLTNSANTVIGNRSFGTDADVVTEYAVAYAKGLQANHVLSTFKHFPGHGATEADTHEGYAYTNKTLTELEQAELKPFAAAQQEGVDFVMAAHISVPNVTGDNTPCSLSETMIQILRENCGYDGIVITDAMNMGAIIRTYSASDAAVKAVSAGVDIILMPENLEEAYSGIYDAVQNGDLSEDRIDDAVRRILKAKM